jgi:REP element-mobilizing transposase RayT
MKVLAAHVIFTAYGFWLPNDPRGSWSDFVASWELLKFGRATKVTTRASVAHVAHDRELRRAAKRALKYPTVRFTGVQARAVARGFARAVHESGYVIYACSILHDHVHLVIAPQLRFYEQIVAHLKGRATQQLKREAIHPLARLTKRGGAVPSPWAEGLWKVYCFDRDHVRNAIRYVEDNPLREDKLPQSWKFVRPYEG